MPRNTIKDYEIMLTRLGKISLKLDQIIHLMKYGAAKNITNHAISMVCEKPL